MGDSLPYLVAERRDGRVMFGDDWVSQCRTLQEARETAQRWADQGATDVVVIALRVVPESSMMGDPGTNPKDP